jgi:hypothetical protein
MSSPLAKSNYLIPNFGFDFSEFVGQSIYPIGWLEVPGELSALKVHPLEERR